MFGFGKSKLKGHRATVSNYDRATHERKLNRSLRIKLALNGELPEDKRIALENELRGILISMNADADTIEKILAR